MKLDIKKLPDTDHTQVVPYRDHAVAGPATTAGAVKDAASSCSIIMVSYYTGPVLIDSIRAALTQAQITEVVLVDNGNSRATLDSLTSLAEDDRRLKIVTGHGNVGFSKGCNMGARAATGRHLLLLNPDCVLRPGVIRRSIEVMAAHPEASALTVRIENTDGTEQRGGRRNLMTPWTCLVEQFRLDRWMPEHPYFQRMNLNETAPFDDVTAVPCISGAFMMVRRGVYESLGGMDEDYFLHVEDVDFCMRIQKMGGVILYVPDAAVTHVKSTSRVFPLVVEWHKSVSATKYFHKHFRPQYPNFVLRMISVALFGRLVVRSIPLTFQWLRQRFVSPGSEPEAAPR